MVVDVISKSPSFEGNLIVKGKISKAQNYLLNLHKPALERKIKDLPFDLFVEQSKSRKTIKLSADVENANAFRVRKNKQNFEQMADLAIKDGKNKSEAYQKLLKANEMFNYTKSIMTNVLFGDFKRAREMEKALAKVAVDNFETYKQIPMLEFKNVPLAIVHKVMVKNLQYKIYRAFSKKTPEEKTFMKMKKEYVDELKAQNKKPQVQEINFPRIYL